MQFYVNVSNTTAATIVKRYMDAGQYYLRVIFNKNAATTDIEVNPGDLHICRGYSDRFTVNYDSTSVTSLTGVMLYVTLGNSIQ